jgi:hypothetical protein
MLSGFNAFPPVAQVRILPTTGSHFSEKPFGDNAGGLFVGIFLTP